MRTTGTWLGLILLLGLAACGGEDPPPAPPPPATGAGPIAPPAPSWGEQMTSAMDAVGRMKIRGAPDLGISASTDLEELRPTLAAAGEILDRITFLPSAEAARLSGRLAEQERRLAETLGTIEQMGGVKSAGSAGAADALRDLKGLVRKTRERIDEARVYYGKTKDYSRPAEVDLDVVYGQIPEYREIVEKRLDEKSPRYLMLLKNASVRFRSAVYSVAEKDGYDLIAGRGAIAGTPAPVPDITLRVVELLPK